VFRLKSALMALGLKCGGTLQERAERYLTSVCTDNKKIMFIRILACWTKWRVKIFLPERIVSC
jgi:hypothetical protein